MKLVVEAISMSPAISLRIAEPNPENPYLLPDTGTFPASSPTAPDRTF
jgi:hypothetical protein